MNKYVEIKEFIDSQSFLVDDYASVKEYNLALRISQMYHELNQLMLSYEKLLNTDKGYMAKIMSQVRQTLYNTICGKPRKQDLIDGINFAIEDLDKILVLEKLEEK